MRDLSVRVLLVLATVALVVAGIASFALVVSQSGASAPAEDLYVYGRR
jgi:hypothetical protein